MTRNKISKIFSVTSSFEATTQEPYKQIKILQKSSFLKLNDSQSSETIFLKNINSFRNSVVVPAIGPNVLANILITRQCRIKGGILPE